LEKEGPSDRSVGASPAVAGARIRTRPNCRTGHGCGCAGRLPAQQPAGAPALQSN